MTPPKKPWTWCNRPGCETKLIFARWVIGPTDPITGKPMTKWMPYEYEDRPPFSEISAGCHVIVAGEAWTPLELIADLQPRLGISEPKARELVTGYPWHRPHRCDPSSSDPTKDAV